MRFVRRITTANTHTHIYSMKYLLFLDNSGYSSGLQYYAICIFSALLLASLLSSDHLPLQVQQNIGTVNLYSHLSRVTKMRDFEFRVELLVSMVEARRILWYKADNVYQDRNNRIKGWREVGWS
jgi:hypothetical protein